MKLRIVEKNGFYGAYGSEKKWSIEVLVENGIFFKKSEWKSAAFNKGLHFFPDYFNSLESAEQEIIRIKKRLEPLETKVVKEYEL